MAANYLEIIRAKAIKDKFDLSQHAQKEAGEEEVSVDDIKQVLNSGRLLEPYPNDPRGASCLIVGQDRSKRWVHVLCGNFDRENFLVITVYLPTLPKWKDQFTRGRSYESK